MIFSSSFTRYMSHCRDQNNSERRFSLVFSSRSHQFSVGELGPGSLKMQGLDKCKINYNTSQRSKHLVNTSFDVSGQGDKLAESLPLKEVAQGVGLGGADIDIADDESVLFWVTEVSEVVGRTE